MISHENHPQPVAKTHVFHQCTIYISKWKKGFCPLENAPFHHACSRFSEPGRYLGTGRPVPANLRIETLAIGPPKLDVAAPFGFPWKPQTTGLVITPLSNWLFIL